MLQSSSLYLPMENLLLKKFDAGDFNIEDFIAGHSERQIEYLNAWPPFNETAESSSNLLMYYGGRRAGKTLGNASKSIVIDRTIPIFGDIIFASATIQKTKDLYWPQLYTANRICKFGWDFKNADNRILTNNSIILFRGLKDMRKADDDMGRKIKSAFIEEPQTIREDILCHYIDNVLSWGMTGVPKAGIYMTGNPPPFRMIYLENLFKNKMIKKIHTDMWDNPSLTNQDIVSQCKNNATLLGFKKVEDAMDHPVFQRNVYGRWVYSTDLVIFDSARIKTFKETPDLKDFHVVMGVDIGGGKAQDAIVCLGWNKYENKIYLLDEKCLETADEDLEDLAAHIKYYYEKYKNKGCEPLAIAIDTGGIGERVVSILRRHYNVFRLVAAKKNQKMAHLELMRTEAYKGRLLFREGSQLLNEFPQIIYTPTRDDIDDKLGLHSDLLDATLYSFRHIFAQFTQERPKPKSYEEQARELRYGRYKRKGSIHDLQKEYQV